MNDRDGDARHEAVHTAARLVEDGRRVEDDGVDAAELLEEHDGARDEQWLHQRSFGHESHAAQVADV